MTFCFSTLILEHKASKMLICFTLREKQCLIAKLILYGIDLWKERKLSAYTPLLGKKLLHDHFKRKNSYSFFCNKKHDELCNVRGRLPT